MAAGRPKPRTVTLNGLTLAFDAGALNLLWIGRGRTAWIKSGQSLWKLLAVDRPGRRVFLTAADAKSVRLQSLGGGVRLMWRGVTDATCKAGPFDVTVDITTDDNDAPGLTRWRMTVVNRSRAWTLWHAEFPRLAGLQPSRQFSGDRLFLPTAWGSQFRGPEMIEFKWRYPRGIFLAMQYLGYSRGKRSLYVGTHDGGLSPKEIEFLPPKQTAKGVTPGSITISNYPPGQSTGGCGLRMEYDTVVGVLDGDWYDASRVYARWARSQPWATTPPAEARPSRGPDRRVQAWLKVSIPTRPMAESAAALERLAKRTGVRLGVHVYNWHQTSFDTNYPDYLPARRGFKQWVARVRRAGVVVMPYINARLWDINAPSWSSRRAARWATAVSGERMEPTTLVQPLEEYGNGQKLAPMCSATPFWQRTVAGLCRQIVHDLGCEGVYLDQVGAEKPELCLNPAHRHPLGGGGWWLDGYRKMMCEIRRAVGPEAVMTTECNWEGCVADYDALLIYHGFGPRQTVPMFPVVYGGLAGVYGPGFSDAAVGRDGGTAFMRAMAQFLVFGGQFGWGDPCALLEPSGAAALKFFVMLCRLRRQVAHLFDSGRMLRPPDVTVRAPGREPPPTALWQNAAVDQWTLLLVNPTRKAITATVHVTEDACRHSAPLPGQDLARAARRGGRPLLVAKLAPASARAIHLSSAASNT